MFLNRKCLSEACCQHSRGGGQSSGARRCQIAVADPASANPERRFPRLGFAHEKSSKDQRLAASPVSISTGPAQRNRWFAQNTGFLSHPNVVTIMGRHQPLFGPRTSNCTGCCWLCCTCCATSAIVRALYERLWPRLDQFGSPAARDISHCSDLVRATRAAHVQFLREGALHLFKGRRLVCADGTRHAPAYGACLRTHIDHIDRPVLFVVPVRPRFPWQGIETRVGSLLSCTGLAGVRTPRSGPFL